MGALLGTGDSIAFGTNSSLDSSNANNFVGYLTDVAGCDVHPSPAGRAVLARAVLGAI